MTRTNEALWQRIKDAVMAAEGMGTKAGEWSARKAQLAVRLYKEAGGEYKGRKSASNSLVKWSEQDWQTKSGAPSHVTGERYLPKKAIAALTPEQYKRTTAAKRRATRRRVQFADQPADVAEVTRAF